MAGDSIGFHDQLLSLGLHGLAGPSIANFLVCAKALVIF